MPRRRKRCRSLAEALQKLEIVIPSHWRQEVRPESDRLIIDRLNGQQFANLLAELINSGKSRVGFCHNTISVRIRINRYQSVLVYVQQMPRTRGNKFQFIFNLF